MSDLTAVCRRDKRVAKLEAGDPFAYYYYFFFFKMHHFVLLVGWPDTADLKHVIVMWFLQ